MNTASVSIDNTIIVFAGFDFRKLSSQNERIYMDIYFFASLKLMMKSYFGELTWGTIVFSFGLIWCLVQITCRIRNKQIPVLWHASCSVYLTCLLSVTILGRRIGTVTNTLSTIFNVELYSGEGLKIWEIYDLLFNIVLFIPCGLLLQYANSDWCRNIRLSFCLSMLIEHAQAILGVGLFELTDLATNTLGGAVGISMAFIIRRIIEAQKNIRMNRWAK